MGSTGRLLLAVAAASVVWGCAGVAACESRSAAPSGTVAARSEAEEAFARGERARRAGQWEDAEASYRAAWKADPRPEFRFFERSDNIVFALRGIPAHTLSSFGMHGDYHQPSDEVERIDFEHLTRVADLVARAARVLAEGPRPTWKPGGRPAPSTP